MVKRTNNYGKYRKTSSLIVARNLFSFQRISTIIWSACPHFWPDVWPGLLARDLGQHTVCSATGTYNFVQVYSSTGTGRYSFTVLLGRGQTKKKAMYFKSHGLSIPCIEHLAVRYLLFRDMFKRILEGRLEGFGRFLWGFLGGFLVNSYGI